MRRLLGRGLASALSLLVIVHIASAQTRVSLSPTNLSFSVPANATTSLTQVVTVAPDSPGAAFQATTRTFGASGGWLSVSPASGSGSTNLTVRVNPAGLPAGTYTGQVTVTSGVAGAVTNVILTVGSGLGSLNVDPSGITLVGQAGDPTLVEQGVTVTSGPNRTDQVRFGAVASSDSQWLTVTPVPLTTPATVSLTATAQNLAAGTYTGSISLIPASGGSPTLVPVTFIVKPSGTVTPELEIGQSSVSVTYQTGTSAPALQDVTITSTTGGALYTATAAASWLKLVSTFNPLPSSSITDIAPGVFRIQTDPTGLNPGTYVDTINITSPGFPSIALPVTLTVTTSPALNAQPSSVILNDTLQTQGTITVTSTGTSKLSFTAAAASAGGWLSVTPSAGSTDSGSQVLTVTANVNALQNGTYNGSVTLTPSGGAPPLTIPVRLTVSNGNSTTVTFITQPNTITLTGIVGQGDPTQAVFVSGGTNSSIDFTAYTTSTGGWLVAEPFRGSTPAQIVVRAKSNAVPGAGTYTGSVILTALRTGDQMTIPVSFTLASQAIVSDTSMLTFTQQKKGVAPPPQQITITSNVANSSYTVGDLPAWLHVQPSRGSTPATVQVWVDIAVLPPGSNTATIQIAGPSNTISIPVTASTLPPAALVVSQSAVSLPYQIGRGAPTPISIGVTSGSADEQIRFVAAATTSSGIAWLSVTPSSGQTPATLTVNIDPTLFIPGQQTGTITITPDNGASPVTIPVTVTVTAAPLVVQQVLNGATMTPTALAPGLIITITGTGLGPVTGLSARPTAAGAYDTILAKTRVLIDGTPAPVLFARNDIVTAIVPYAVFGRLSARLQVEESGNPSVPVELRVVDQAPGLFTISGTGRGQANAINADLTSNSGPNPAPRGSVIALYGTGDGQTDPAGQDGRIILTDVRHPILPVTATVGGKPATVTYAGSASGLVSGLLQVNVRIPDDVDPGVQPVQIFVGGVGSQSGVTIVVQ